MRSFIKALYSMGLGCTAIIAMGISGCDESKDIQNWVDHAGELRAKAEDQLPNTPYRRDQHGAFKSYFTELNNMALNLKTDEKLKRRYNEAAGQANLNDVCRKLFVPRSRWLTLMQNCRKNRFFLCAEEVRAYPTQVEGMRAALNAELQRKFDQAASCQAGMAR